MSIQREKNGTYTLNYSIRDAVSNKLIRTKKRGFRTQKEAKEFEKSLDRGTGVLFYTLFEECQKSTEQENDTYKSKVSIINNYLPSLLSVRYIDLTKPYMLELRNNIAKLELAPKTKNTILGVIAATCKYANRVYDLPDNSKIMKRFKQTKKEFDVWTPEEYQRFEDALTGTKYEDCVPFFHLLFNSGLRKGEARALTVDDLNVEDSTITVNKSIRKYQNSIKAPKTPNSVRKIKIDRITLNYLIPLKSHEKWLFGDYKAISRDRVDNAFHYGIQLSNVKPIRIHDLRHSHATYLINNGGNIVAISKRLGHSSINMTLSTYAHLLQESENRLIEIIECSQSVAN